MLKKLYHIPNINYYAFKEEISSLTMRFNSENSHDKIVNYTNRSILLMH